MVPKSVFKACTLHGLPRAQDSPASAARGLLAEEQHQQRPRAECGAGGAWAEQGTRFPRLR